MVDGCFVYVSDGSIGINPLGRKVEVFFAFLEYAFPCTGIEIQLWLCYFLKDKRHVAELIRGVPTLIGHFFQTVG